MAASTNGNGNIVDEFEEAFQQCLTLIIRDEAQGSNGLAIGGLTSDKDEVRGEVEQVTFRFLDLARQMEAFFLQKRFLLSTLKPEMVVKEDILELKAELARKEELIKRHYEKIATWQNLLADLQGWAKSPAQGPSPNGPANGAQGVPVPQGGNGGAGQTMQQQQQLLQQQQLQQQLHQHQLQQQQMHQQVPSGSGGPPPPGMQGVNVGQQGMFMGQPVARPGGFPVGNVQSPLAYLEKTTSNIGMPERRS